MAGRYDIALKKIPKKPMRKQNETVVAHEDTVVAQVSNFQGHTEQTRPSNNFTIACPNGFRVTIPIRHLNLVASDGHISVGLPRSTILSIINDVNEARTRANLSPL